jgi:RNA polymerase sigma-70 factor (ECF subfamily)
VDRRRSEFTLAPELVARSTVPASRPETSSNAPVPTTRWSQVVAAIAAGLGMTEGAVKMAASRLRKRYGEILREEIARTVANPADVEDEVRALFAALAR